MIKVLLADDHALLRGSLKQLLEDTGYIQVVAQAGEYSEIMKAMTANPTVELAILDISMPGKNGVDVVKILKDKYPALKILMLSMHPEDQYAVRSLKAGASGYLTKNTAPEKLVDAIQVIAAGRKYITPELAESLASHLTEDTEKPLHSTLSDREFQTIRLIAAGKKLSEIAEELSLSPKTVSVYRARILEKMRMKTNGELTRYALEHGLI
ncbi:MAG TPA: response regulator transcription factor [Limnobacter sp.]|uniref:response regulator transcription factor n=1 Tax=Limnobacter sp. TaxID=2003368 RepID=UPI002EDB2C6B